MIEATTRKIRVVRKEEKRMVIKRDKSLNTLHPTLAGIVMFGDDSLITSVLPDYFFDYREVEDAGKTRWIDRIHSGSGD